MKQLITEIGRPLVSIELELTSIRFCFQKGVVQFGDEFMLVASEGNRAQIERFVPWKKEGNINNIWMLIDVSSPRLEIDLTSLRLLFENGYYLECYNRNEVPEQVNIWGFESEAARKAHPNAEFLTNYPGDYLEELRNA